jgi:hypothetical protein
MTLTAGTAVMLLLLLLLLLCFRAPPGRNFDGDARAELGMLLARAGLRGEDWLMTSLARKQQQQIAS